MEVRTFAGRRATNRPGAAEYLGRSLKSVHEWASPRKREAVGWPAPVATVGREHWYALADLDRFHARYIAAVEDAHRARVHQASWDDPETLVSAKEFRERIRVSYGTWSRWVAESQPAWERGEDGYLPRPDAEEPARHGVIRKWKAHRAAAWINQRPGKVPSPGRPPRHHRRDDT